MALGTMAEPATETEVAELLRDASKSGRTVEVRGGGSKHDWGGVPAGCDVLLSTRRLDRLVEHAAGDLICVAGAGMPLTALQEALAAAPGYRQRLMLDPANPSGKATLGGIVATGASGRLRTRYGTMRNLLIGVRFVLSDGTVGHAGGKVVKNVAGYDMGKLLTGSLGTLAVVTEVALRLHPQPEASALVAVPVPTAAAAADAITALRRLPATLSMVDVVWPDRMCLVQVDSSRAGAIEQSALIAQEMGGRVLSDEEAANAGLTLGQRPWVEDGPVVGVAAPRRRLAELIEAVADHSHEAVFRGPLATGEARLPADQGNLDQLQRRLRAVGGHMSLRRARGLHLDVAADIDPVALDLMRAVKRALDPTGTLAPGRAVGMA